MGKLPSHEIVAEGKRYRVVVERYEDGFTIVYVEERLEDRMGVPAWVDASNIAAFAVAKDLFGGK